MFISFWHPSSLPRTTINQLINFYEHLFVVFDFRTHTHADILLQPSDFNARIPFYLFYRFHKHKRSAEASTLSWIRKLHTFFRPVPILAVAIEGVFGVLACKRICGGPSHRVFCAGQQTGLSRSVRDVSRRQGARRPLSFSEGLVGPLTFTRSFCLPNTSPSYSKEATRSACLSALLVHRGWWEMMRSTVGAEDEGGQTATEMTLAALFFFIFFSF